MDTSKSSECPVGFHPWRILPVRHAIITLLLVVATIIICSSGTLPPEKSESGVVMKLPPLLGDFLGIDQEVSNSERVILPPDTEFAKKLYEDASKNQINCQIVLSGAEKRSIHRPEVCLPAQGWGISSRQVVPVTLSNGNILNVMQLTITRQVRMGNGAAKTLTSLYYYWFVGKNANTPYHFERVLKTNLDMLLHNTSHRWAYVIVNAPVLEGFVPNGKNKEQTQEILLNFISALAPQIMKSEGARESVLETTKTP